MKFDPHKIRFKSEVQIPLAFPTCLKLEGIKMLRPLINKEAAFFKDFLKGYQSSGNAGFKKN